MTFLGLEARTDLPKVPYPTALDFFVFLSFAFIFATIIQFAVVHYFTKYGSGECYFSSDLSDTESSSDEEDLARRLVKNRMVNDLLSNRYEKNTKGKKRIFFLKKSLQFSSFDFFLLIKLLIFTTCWFSKASMYNDISENYWNTKYSFFFSLSLFKLQN